MLFGQSSFSCAIKSFLFLQSVDQSSSVSIFCFFSLFLQMTKVRKRVGRVAVARAQFSRMNLLIHSRQLTPSSTPIHIQVCSLLTTLLPPANLDNFSNQKGHGDCFSVTREVKSNETCGQIWVKDPPQVTSTFFRNYREAKNAKCVGLSMEVPGQRLRQPTQTLM